MPFKVRVAPYVVLLVVVLGVLDDRGVIDLGGGPAATPHHRPAHRPQAAAPAGRVDVPAGYLRWYRHAGAGEAWPDPRTGRRYAAWAVLAGVGKVESDHGRSAAPGVRTGLNRAGCCAGPMQFNLHDGPPSTWARYGRGSVYDPADAIAAAARKLRADDARTDVRAALYGYNHAGWYVAEVLALARRYQARDGGR